MSGRIIKHILEKGLQRGRSELGATGRVGEGKKEDLGQAGDGKGREILAALSAGFSNYVVKKRKMTSNILICGPATIIHH